MEMSAILKEIFDKYCKDLKDWREKLSISPNQVFREIKSTAGFPNDDMNALQQKALDNYGY